MDKPGAVDMDLPFLTRDLPPVPGAIKQQVDDFCVEEIPLYEPCGTGTHVYFRIEKRNVTTIKVVRDIARTLNVKARDIGYAGLKDARAVTRQMLSVEHVDPKRIETLALPSVCVLDVSRHGNKLRLGHLRGNRFAIKLREAPGEMLDRVREVLSIIARRGVPNYFGPQRFGVRGDTWRIGRAMIRQDWRECIDVMLGGPGEGGGADVRQARELYEDGRYAEAAEAWPWSFRDEKRACRALARTDSHRRAFFAVDKTLKRLYVSAYQGWLFNAVAATRIDGIDRVMAGDLAWLHGKGAVFRVEDVEAEQARCDAHEICPSGPLFGYRMTEPDGEPGRIEQQVLAAQEHGPEAFRAEGAHKVKGGRRPLRFVPKECSAECGRDELGEFVELRFVLPSGCYATALLREICKTDFA